jgi:hypothetical protein
MTTKRFVSIVVAIGSVALGGAAGSAALKQANAAPLAGSATLVEASTIAAVNVAEPTANR